MKRFCRHPRGCVSAKDEGMFSFRIRAPKILLLFACEAGLIFGLLLLLSQVSAVFIQQRETTTLSELVQATLLFSACVLLTRRREFWQAADLRTTAVMAGVGAALLTAAALAVLTVDTWTPLPPRSLMIEGAVAVPFAVIAWRWAVVRYRVLGGYPERILLVGEGEAARAACRWFEEHASRHVELVGAAVEDPARKGHKLAMGVPIVTDFASLLSHCPGRVDRILVAMDEKRGRMPVDKLLSLRTTGIVIEDAVAYFERTAGKIAVETLLPSGLIFSDGFRVSPSRMALKRAADVALSLLLLLLLLPVFALIAIAIRLDSSGPVFYRQARVGRFGREFAIIKFRSMVRDAENLLGPTWARPDDSRITRVGRFLRLTRIDELPQLWNVLRGDMSFVGPRPERRYFIQQLEKSSAYYPLRLALRPGMTGWAQVNYCYSATVEQSVEKLKYDLFYVKHMGFFLDLWIMLKTMRVVALGEGAR